MNLMAESGFEAKLEIVSATDSLAVIRDINIKRDGEAVLSADELRLDYLWPDIRDGKIERVEIDQPSFTVRLDEKGQLADAWLLDMLSPDDQSGADESDDAFAFPVNGVAIKAGVITVLSPMGQANLTLDTEIASADEFDASLTLASANIDHRDLVTEGQGKIDISRKGASIDLDGQIETDRLGYKSLSLQEARFRVDGTFDLTAKSYAGEVGVVGMSIESDVFAAKAINYDWDGSIQMPHSANESVTAAGSWALQAQDAKLPKTERVDMVAETLSLYPALSVMPVSEHYAGSLKSTVKDFFAQTQLEASGQIDYGAHGFAITTDKNVSFVSDNNRLTLTPLADTDIYVFDRANQTLQARMSARFEKPVGLTLKDIDLRAGSPNGYQLAGVRRFSAQVNTDRNWKTTALEDGRPVRLGPLSTQIQYDVGTRSPRRVSLQTQMDYDGPVPGGRVGNLDLVGQIDVRLYEGWQSLDFTPKPDRPVTFDRLETPTEWTLTNARFHLPATENIFVRKLSQSVMQADLQDADFMATRPTEQGLNQQVHVTSQSADLKGILTPDLTQNWSVALETARYESENLPGPGTRASAEQANITARLKPDTPAKIHLTSPSVMASTPLVDVTQMGIDLSGTTDNYVVAYTGGTLKMIGSEAAEKLEAAGYASFPLDGEVVFADGRFDGQAVLRIAKANDAGVNIDYSYANGAGEADIDIPSVMFDPSGLQPQQLWPSLRGKISRVSGEARAKFQIAFSDGALTRSVGQLDVVDMDIATAPGPLDGVNTIIRFDSLWPVETSGLQILTVDSFNPGYAMKNGTMSYRLISDGIIVESAKWPIGKGALSLDPFTWRFLAEENRVIMRVENISLNDVLKELESEKLEATGTVTGTFPILVRGVEVLVEAGEIAVPEGGVIKYNSGLPGKSYTQEEALKVFREKRTNEYAAVARDALKEFSYRSLSMGVDGPLDGRIDIGLVFDGSNPKVLNNQPFRFNLNVGGKLLNIMQSFNSNAQIKSEILNQTGLDIDKVPAIAGVP